MQALGEETWEPQPPSWPLRPGCRAAVWSLVSRLSEATSSSKGGPSREADSWEHTASLHKSQQGSNVLFRQAQRHVLVIPAPRKITNSS